MKLIRVQRLLPILVILGTTLAAEKQIKLEDIEKDNLKAAQQAKFEKQYQEYQQYQTYQQPGLSYQQQPSIAYQPQAQPQPQQQQYVLPYNAQQYLQQALYQGNYQQLANNGISANYPQQAPQSAPVHPFQNYFSQQLQQVPVPSQTHGQPQALIMAYSAPSLAAFQQQAAAYYQNTQIPPYYFQQQPQQHQQQDVSPVPQSPLPSSAYSPYVPPFQAVNSIRAPTGVQYSENNLASPFATASHYTGQTYSQPQEATFLKSPQSAASLKQQQQFLSAVGSTVSPLQSKYINSPQYLAQNYNTIPSTYLLPKAYSGLKPTASPSVKIATQGGFLPSSPLSSGSTNYQTYRSISG